MNTTCGHPEATQFRLLRTKTIGRTILCALLAAFIPNGAAAEQPGQEQDIRLIREMLEQAENQSPAARAARARHEAAQERVTLEQVLPDPMVGYGWFFQPMETRQIFRVEQPLPGFGKRESRAAVATEGARAASETVGAVTADIRFGVLENVADWVTVRQSQRLVAETITLVGKLEQVALQRYRTGDASQADVLRLQMEKESLEVDLRDWRERETVARAAVNALLGRAGQEPLEAPADLPLPPLDPADQLLEPTRHPDNPDLRRSHSLVRQAERGRELARREARPDFGIGLEYMDNRGHARDEVMAMVTVQLPLWPSRQRSLRGEAASNLRAARDDHAATLLAIESGVTRARQELLDARRRVVLYEESLLPRARQSLSILESDYRTGRSGFLDLLDAQRTLLELELLLARARADYFTRLAWWERLTGQSLILQNLS